ncbi:hypothetical protein [Intrasporangium flavum]|uniref:hypothetical protein n=1 Tax=Intrasporangium flavum TaxID=1428657 RepID=UPI00096D3EB9|nr:hypothetical protein [Intrasporangium flavum]
MTPKRYDPADDHEPLPFQIDARGGVEGSERRASVRSVKFGICPGHTDDGSAKRTGLLPQGLHLVWRYHQTKTFGGVAIDCPSSGQPVCTSPSRPGQRVDCSCGATPETAA